VETVLNYHWLAQEWKFIHPVKACLFF